MALRATYFTDKELACQCGCGFMPKDELVMKLDSLRLLVGEPLVVNSAARCPRHNKDVGGAPYSAHIKGLAVDIKCKDPALRHRLVESFFIVGFKRMEWGTKTWLHFDIWGEPIIFLP